jgi:hypothetical protein
MLQDSLVTTPNFTVSEYPEYLKIVMIRQNKTKIVKGIKFVGKHCSWTASVGVESVYFLSSVNRLREVLYFNLCLFISNKEYCYKSIFKLNIKGNRHSSRWEKANFARITTWRIVPILLKSPEISLENIDGAFRDFSWFMPNFATHK